MQKDAKISLTVATVAIVLILLVCFFTMYDKDKGEEDAVMDCKDPSELEVGDYYKIVRTETGEEVETTSLMLKVAEIDGDNYHFQGVMTFADGTDSGIDMYGKAEDFYKFLTKDISTASAVDGVTDTYLGKAVFDKVSVGEGMAGAYNADYYFIQGTNILFKEVGSQALSIAYYTYFEVTESNVFFIE